MLNWSEKCRYKILGHRISYEGEVLYVFELDETEIFFERKKQTKKQAISGSESISPEQKEERLNEEKKMSMKPFYPDDWGNSFGIPVDEHKNVSIGTLDDYANKNVFQDRKLE